MDCRMAILVSVIACIEAGHQWPSHRQQAAQNPPARNRQAALNIAPTSSHRSTPLHTIPAHNTLHLTPIFVPALAPVKISSHNPAPTLSSRHMILDDVVIPSSDATVNSINTPNSPFSAPLEPPPSIIQSIDPWHILQPALTPRHGSVFYGLSRTKQRTPSTQNSLSIVHYTPSNLQFALPSVQYAPSVSQKTLLPTPHTLPSASHHSPSIISQTPTENYHTRLTIPHASSIINQRPSISQQRPWSTHQRPPATVHHLLQLNQQQIPVTRPLNRNIPSEVYHTLPAPPQRQSLRFLHQPTRMVASSHTLPHQHVVKMQHTHPAQGGPLHEHAPGSLNTLTSAHHLQPHLQETTFWSQWRQWSACSKSCGYDGEQRRHRMCVSGNCPGSHVHRRRCNQVCCSVHGNWSLWSDWSIPYVFQRNRYRTCSQPAPSCYGRQCQGANQQSSLFHPPPTNISTPAIPLQPLPPMNGTNDES